MPDAELQHLCGGEGQATLAGSTNVWHDSQPHLGGVFPSLGVQHSMVPSSHILSEGPSQPAFSTSDIVPDWKSIFPATGVASALQPTNPASMRETAPITPKIEWRIFRLLRSSRTAVQTCEMSRPFNNGGRIIAGSTICPVTSCNMSLPDSHRLRDRQDQPVTMCCKIRSYS